MPVLALVIAAIFVAAELAVSARYGLYQDELYFIVPGHHLAFGHVDQLKPHFASCRVLTTCYSPYDVQNEWTDLQASAPARWPAWRTL